MAKKKKKNTSGVTFAGGERTTGKEKRKRAHDEIRGAAENMKTLEPKKKKERAVPEYSPMIVECGTPPPRNSLEWMLYPLPVDEFFEKYWEKRPLVIKRGKPDYYDGLFSKDQLLSALDSHELKYGTHFNLAKFDGENKVMQNIKDSGERATRDEVEGSLQKGVSVQCMHPQQYDEDVWTLMEKLETEMGCLWGSNSYYTPAKSQFTAPHFDDVEVFMLQVEGAKHWEFRRHPDEYADLPKVYSPNFTQEQKENMKLLYKCDVERGDLVYLPRGTVHEGRALDVDSHHLTVSTYQKFSWSHFLEEILPPAVEKAFQMDRRFQEGLPKAFVDYMGSRVMRTSPQEVAQSEAFVRHVKTLLSAVVDHIDIDAACDSIASEFLLQRLPPTRQPAKGPSPENGCKKGIHVRLHDRRLLRCMNDIDPETGEMQVLLFHPYSNARKQHMCGIQEDPPGVLRLETLFFPCLQALFQAKDKFIPMQDLPLETEDKEVLCDLLWELDILETKETNS